VRRTASPLPFRTPATGSTGGQGRWAATTCQRPANSFTSLYRHLFAPSSIASTGITYVVATAALRRQNRRQPAAQHCGVSSNPMANQVEQLSPAELGSSGGNNNDLRSSRQPDRRLLRRHAGIAHRRQQWPPVPARQQPCAGAQRPGHRGRRNHSARAYRQQLRALRRRARRHAVGSLTGWLPLSSSTTNADAAIALVMSGTVDPTGSILELGGRQLDGSLGAAPPGVSSTGGKGETGRPGSDRGQERGALRVSPAPASPRSSRCQRRLLHRLR